MRDISLRVLRSKTASAVISINGNEHEVNSEFSILSKVYNEMYGTDVRFSDLVRKYVRQCKDKELLKELKELPL